MPATNAEFDGHPSFSPFQSLDRPESLRPASRSVSAASLYRLAAAAGMGSALVLLVNAAKRSGIIATTDLTQLLAPLAEIMALGLVGGLFLAVGRRAGLFGVFAFLSHFIALASLEGVEVVINLVFSKLPVETVAELRGGPLGLLLTISSLLFLLSSLAFAVSLLVERSVPRVPLALYIIGVVPIAFRAFVPELALDLGLVSLAAGIMWLAGWLWTRAGALID